MKTHDVPGNAAMTAAAVQRIGMRLAGKVLGVETLVESLETEEIWLIELRIKFGAADDGGCLAVVKTQTAEGRFVGFHSAPTFAETVEGVINRLENRSMKWREDQYG